ncbi:MAG: hypothetical protein FWF60_08950 [Oscillospiraceae bacterium]|nr:hypothetical protein [Oscillospiraceae bacterium]
MYDPFYDIGSPYLPMQYLPVQVPPMWFPAPPAMPWMPFPFGLQGGQDFDFSPPPPPDFSGVYPQ